MMFSSNCNIKNLDGKIDFWVINPLQNVYRQSELPEIPQTKIELVSALNEYESMQIALRSRFAFTVKAIEFMGDNAGNLTYHFVDYEEKATTQAENSITPWTTNMTLYPLSAVPDPLSNEASVSVSADETQSVFITHYAPSDMIPGTYESSVIIRTTLGDVEVSVTVTVCNVKIPCITDANLVNYHWTMTNGFADGTAWDKNSKPAYDVGKWYYDIQTYSEQWFELMNEFALVLTKYRNNMAWIRTDLFLREKGIFLSDFTKGMPNNLDWSLFDRYVQIFIDKGIVRFANTHLVHALYHMPEEERPTEKTKKQWQKSIPDKLPMTDTFLTNYLTALYIHLKEKGWTKQNGFTWYQHIRDEPIYPEHKNWWAYAARKIKQINEETGSEFVTMDADPDGILLAG